ncbi:hypothetical protein ACQJBY_065137 [Aegilops geniculata]
MHVRLHATRLLRLPPAPMASTAVARHPPLLVLVLIIVVLLLSSSSTLAAAGPPSASAGQGFHVATTPLHDASVAKSGGWRRPVGGERRRRADRGRGRGGGTGAWAFSAMLPRGFVPPSGSSACHNDMPATATDAQFYTCGGSVRP